MKFLNFVHTDGPALGAQLADGSIFNLSAAWDDGTALRSVDVGRLYRSASPSEHTTAGNRNRST